MALTYICGNTICCAPCEIHFICFYFFRSALSRVSTYLLIKMSFNTRNGIEDEKKKMKVNKLYSRDV